MDAASAIEGIVEVVRKVNVPDDILLRNIKLSVERGLPQAVPYEKQDKVVYIVCGGPSLAYDDLPETGPLISTNGTHDWLLEHGRKPSMHIQVDARPFNARFVKNWQKGTKYFIASQSDPSVFDALEGADVTLFNCAGQDEEFDFLMDRYGGMFYNIPVGGTVGLRAITLMDFLGFRNIEMFGFDSCFLDDSHHKFSQEENNGDIASWVEVGGRKFLCSAWMFEQAKDFIKLVKLVDDVNLVVHGDGLIAHILKMASERYRGQKDGS